MTRPVVLALCTAALALAGTASTAGAQCPAVAPLDALSTAPAAVVGTVTSVRDVPDPGPGGADDLRRVFTLSVEKAIKGEVGATAEINAGHVQLDGTAVVSSESLHPSVGQRLGLVLGGAAPEWESSACDSFDPDALLRAAVALAAQERCRAPRLTSVKIRWHPRSVRVDALAYDPDGRPRALDVAFGSIVASGGMQARGRHSARATVIIVRHAGVRRLTVTVVSTPLSVCGGGDQRSRSVISRAPRRVSSG